MSFDLLPLELIHLILDFLSDKELISLSETSKLNNKT